MIAGDQEHGNPGTRHTLQGLERLVDQARLHSWPVKEIAAVDEKIDALLHGSSAGTLVVGQEVLAPTAAADAGVGRMIESQVRIRDEQNPDVIG